MQSNNPSLVHIKNNSKINAMMINLLDINWNELISQSNSINLICIIRFLETT